MLSRWSTSAMETLKRLAMRSLKLLTTRRLSLSVMASPTINSRCSSPTFVAMGIPVRLLPGDLHRGKGFDHVAHLDVVVADDLQAALQPRPHLANVFLEPPQAVQLPV